MSFLRSAVCVLACFGTMALPAGEPSPNIAGETINQTAARTGHTAEEIKRFFPPIQEWSKYGIEPAPDKMAESFAKDRFTPPPAPYAHPRVYFNAQDLPSLRQRLTSNRVGQVMMGSIRGMLLQIHPEEAYWKDLANRQRLPGLKSSGMRGACS